MYVSTKTITHAHGLSCAFRQWRAESHCRFIHGYALQVRMEFEAYELDARNWVVDFGGLKGLKKSIENIFDHTLLVAQDDPQLDDLCMLTQLGVARVIVLPNVGCEAFAKHIYKMTCDWLDGTDYAGRCRVRRVEVSEHAGNSAIFEMLRA